MQLKTVGESLNAIKDIENIINKYSSLGGTLNEHASLGHRLAEAMRNYSTESVKAAISNSNLNEIEIEAILSTKGLAGATLETTAAELAATAQTNALSTSQLGSTITSSNLKLAIKGLGTEIKGLVSDVSIFLKAHPCLTGMAVTLALIAASIKGVNAFQDWADRTTAVNKYNESLEKSEQTISDNEKSISDYNSEIETNKKKIEELQELQSNGTITDAQKTEIENLKYQNALLDEKIEKLKQANDEELKAQTRTAENKFNTQFNESGDNTKSSNAKNVIERVSKNFWQMTLMTKNCLTENKTLLIKNRKTEALNALEKQYSAYQGDNSEEGKKNIQQLKEQINSAKDDLIQDIIEQSNENASDISQTINSTAENYGYNLSKSLLCSTKNVNLGKFN